MPEYHPNGPGWPEYTFTTVDGYKYIVRAQYDGTARLLNVWTPDGEHYYGETLDAFTVKVLVQYLALAAALSGILVVLLTVSNAIRKRNEKLKMDN